MLVNRDTHPERDIYYLGSKVIEIISEEDVLIDFLEVYRKINLTESVSMNLYSLTLDWLYMIGVIDSFETGKIQKCF